MKFLLTRWPVPRCARAFNGVAGPAPRFPLFSAGGSPWGTSPHRPTPAPVGYFSLSRCPRFCFFISEWDTQCYATYSQNIKISHFSTNAISQNGKKGKNRNLQRKAFYCAKKTAFLSFALQFHKYHRTFQSLQTQCGKSKRPIGSQG